MQSDLLPRMRYPARSVQPVLVIGGWLFLLSLLLFCTPVAWGQTRFGRTEGTVAPATYRRIDHCYALAERLMDSVSRIRYTDTLVLTHEYWIQPLSPSVTGAVRQCAVQFQVDSVAIADWKIFAKLFLIAGLENEVRQIMMRRLAAIPSAAAPERMAVLDSMVQLYISDQARPTRVSAIDSILPLFDTLRTITGSWEDQFNSLSSAFWRASRHKDSVRARDLAKQLIAFGQTLTDRDRDTRFFEQWVRAALFGAYEYLGHAESLDSLRKSGTKAFIAMKFANFAKVTGGKIEFPFPVGHQAPVIAGMWFDRDAKPISGPVVRPTRGKVALVVFCDAEYMYSRIGFEPASTLRRLYQRFPDLEINVLSTGTTGYFGPRLFTDTLAEGQMLANYWMGFHKIPGALAVEPTSFWLLPDPDRRRMNQEISNTQAYRDKLGIHQAMGNGEGYLIDRNGVVVEWFPQGVHSGTEENIGALVEVLLTR